MVRGPLCRVGVAVGRDDEGGGPLDLSGFGMIRRLSLPGLVRSCHGKQSRPETNDTRRLTDGRLTPSCHVFERGRIQDIVGRCDGRGARRDGSVWHVCGNTRVDGFSVREDVRRRRRTDELSCRAGVLRSKGYVCHRRLAMFGHQAGRRWVNQNCNQVRISESPPRGDG